MFINGRVLALLSLLGAGLANRSEAQTAPAQAPDRASAYYYSALGHLYADLAAQYGGRGEYVTKAIDNYKLAMRNDPDSAYLAEELADLYLQTGQVRSAASEFEEVVKRNPDDVNARRILGRIYTARLREGSQNRANQEMLTKALEQYEKISLKAPKDADNWVMLGRLYKLAQKSTDAEKAYKKALELQPENEEAMTGLAIVYSDLGDNANATAMLKRVAEKNPSMRTLTALAGTYEQMKEFKLAADAYKKALDQNPGNADLKRAYAQSLFQADDMDAASVVFEELAAEDPNDLLANLRLSQIYRQKKDFVKARQFAKKARDLDPSNLEIRFNEVSLLEAEGKTQEAIDALKEILSTNARGTATTGEKSNRIILLERLGFLYRQADQTANAVKTFQEIGEIEPDAAARASAQVVETYRGAKDFANAEKAAKAAVEKYPSDRTVKLVAANLYADMGKTQSAVDILKGLMDGKNDREVYLSLAQVYEKAKNYPEMAQAIDNAEKLSKSDDDKENIYFVRGAMLEKQKKYDAAETEFRKVLKINPDSAAALNYLGYMLADRNVRVNEAVEMIRKAVDQEPTNGAYLDSLGWAYFRLNKLDEAEDYLQKAVQKTSKDPTVHDHLAEVYQARGRLKDAVVEWEKAVAEWQATAPTEQDPAEVAKVQKKLESAKVRLAKETGAKK
jgi:tetratricopeptide (TPR) repeat protein